MVSIGNLSDLFRNLPGVFRHYFHEFRPLLEPALVHTMITLRLLLPARPGPGPWFWCNLQDFIIVVIDMLNT